MILIIFCINRAVPRADALELANQSSAMFFEVSAADARNMETAIYGMATKLKQNFDKDIERGKQDEDKIILRKSTNSERKNGFSCFVIDSCKDFFRNRISNDTTE